MLLSLLCTRHWARCHGGYSIHNSWFLNCHCCLIFVCMSCLDCGSFWFVYVRHVYPVPALFQVQKKIQWWIGIFLSGSQNLVGKTLKIMFIKQWDKFCTRRVCKMLPKASGSRCHLIQGWGIKYMCQWKKWDSVNEKVMEGGVIGKGKRQFKEEEPYRWKWRTVEEHRTSNNNFIEAGA